LLPRRNVQVLLPSYDCAGDIVPEDLALAIREHFTQFDLVEGENDVALAFRWSGAPSYVRIRAFADGIIQGMKSTLAQETPLYLILDGDLAHTLGALLREELELKSEVLVIDGVILWDFDYIDLGRIRMPSQTVPVTVKSLVFSQDPRTPAGNVRTDLKYRPHAHEHGSRPHAHHHHGHAHDHDHGHDHAHADRQDHGHVHSHEHDHEHSHAHGREGGGGHEDRRSEDRNA